MDSLINAAGQALLASGDPLGALEAGGASRRRPRSGLARHRDGAAWRLRPREGAAARRRPRVRPARSGGAGAVRGCRGGGGAGRARVGLAGEGAGCGAGGAGGARRPVERGACAAPGGAAPVADRPPGRGRTGAGAARPGAVSAGRAGRLTMYWRWASALRCGGCNTAAAREALARARHAAGLAGIPALAAEVESAFAVLDSPAARLIARGVERPLLLADVEALLASGAFIVDAYRHVVRDAGKVVSLAGRPVLFALARALAEAWPGDVSRVVLIARAFRGKFADESHRARLRVEVGRLRGLLRPLAEVTATKQGFATGAAPRPRGGWCWRSIRWRNKTPRCWRSSPTARRGRARPWRWRSATASAPSRGRSTRWRRRARRGGSAVGARAAGCRRHCRESRRRCLLPAPLMGD